MGTMVITMGLGTRGEESTGRPVSPVPSAQQQSMAVSPILQKREAAGLAPLSFAQERLWFLHQINQDDVSDNISRGQRIKGELKRDLLDVGD